MLNTIICVCSHCDPKRTGLLCRLSKTKNISNKWFHYISLIKRLFVQQKICLFAPIKILSLILNQFEYITHKIAVFCQSKKREKNIYRYCYRHQVLARHESVSFILSLRSLPPLIQLCSPCLSQEPTLLTGSQFGKIPRPCCRCHTSLQSPESGLRLVSAVPGTLSPEK